MYVCTYMHVYIPIWYMKDLSSFMIITNEYLIFNNKISIYIYITQKQINKFITCTHAYQIHTNISHTHTHTSTSFAIIVKHCVSHFLCVLYSVFQRGSHCVAQVDQKVTAQLMLGSSLYSYCLSLLSAGMIKRCTTPVMFFEITGSAVSLLRSV